jgi:hypothetical protein
VRREVWIGLVHVKPGSKTTCIGDRGGAFAATVALAADEKEFGERVERFMAPMDLHVIQIENLERLAARLKVSEVEEELLELSKTLSEEDPVGVDTLDTYPAEAPS